MPSSESPPASAATKRSTLSISARPSRSRTVSASICSTPLEMTWSSIDSASRMPPAARWAIRSSASSVIDRPSASAMRRSLAVICFSGSGRKVKRCSRRDDCRSDARRIGRAEDEQDVGRRLLERLEEDVPALLDALDLVDDEDLLLAGRPARCRRAAAARACRRRGCC